MIFDVGMQISVTRLPADKRYDRSLVGASVVRLDARDPEARVGAGGAHGDGPGAAGFFWVTVVLAVFEFQGLLYWPQCTEAVERWNFDYLERYLADVDNFFVLCAPVGLQRFSTPRPHIFGSMNECPSAVPAEAPTNERREMRFPNFRQKVPRSHMQGLVQWLEAPETCDSDQSTVDVAWSLLRRAWKHRKDGNDLLSEKPGTAQEQYSLGVSCVAKAAGLAALEGLQTTDPFEYRDFLNASKLVEGVTEVHIGVGALHRNLSLLMHQQGDYEASVRHADASLKAEPGHLKSKYRRAAALLHLRRYGEAEADLQEILAQDPRNSDARRLLRSACDRAPSPPPRPSATSKIDSEVLREPLQVPDAGPTCGCPVCQLWKETMSAGDTAVEFLRTSAEKVTVLLARRDAEGRTALHLAVMAPEDRASDPPATPSAGRCQGLVEALLEKGAEVELTDVDERTPLHLAARDGRTQAVSLLLDAGSEVDALDRFGRTPLYYAAQGNHRDVVALLVDRGHADQSILFHALKEKFGTHNFVLQDWPEYNGRWMSSRA
ncbi:ANKRD50 [Symbiodinium sp. CCMP2592]|nr:ANKRD50 [Symbiodinium sp. CCMP2592]